MPSFVAGRRLGADDLNAAFGEYPTPAVLQWVGNTSPLPPQAIDRRAGDPTVTGQQDFINDWLQALIDDSRAGYLPRGVYRYSGETPVLEVVGYPLTITGEGRHSRLWGDDTYSGGPLLAFRGVSWIATQPYVPTGLLPPTGKYVALQALYLGVQAWRGGLLLRDFSVTGTTTNLTTGEIVDLDQTGIAFYDNTDFLRMHGVGFFNIRTGMVSKRKTGTGAAGLREVILTDLYFRGCGWGETNAAFDLDSVSTVGDSHNYLFMDNCYWATGHGIQMRLRQPYVDGQNPLRLLNVERAQFHGTPSWDPDGVHYDASIPTPGGSFWNLVHIEGDIEQIRIDATSNHSQYGKYTYYIGADAASGVAPRDIWINGINRGASVDLINVAAGTNINIGIMKMTGGRITVQDGVVGPVNILPTTGDTLDLDLVGSGAAVTYVASRTTNLTTGMLALGSDESVKRRTMTLVARAFGSAGGAFAWPDDTLSNTDIAAQTATVIPIPTASMAVFVCRVKGINPAAIYGEWDAVVVVQRLTDEASTTILAGPTGSGVAPDRSSGSASAWRLVVAADTTTGGITFSVTPNAVTADYSLEIETRETADVVSANATAAQTMLLSQARALIAGFADTAPLGVYADDTAAGVGGLTTGQKYIVSSTGAVATKA